ncbi:MAG: amidohydrolase family protein [Opitutaceae bacterium]|nr:amidohydrolase family protein [Opitutaceae bacterium]
MSAASTPVVIDAHVHFWDPRRFRYPWLASLPALNRAFLPEDYQQASAFSRVAKFIFVECDCDAPHRLDEVKWISDLARIESRLKGIVAHAAVETATSIRAHLATLARNPLVKGVRRILQSEADPNFCLQPNFIAGVEALADFGFTFDLCVVPAQLPAVTELARRCHRVQFILDHCGKPAIRDGRLDPWRQQLRELAALPNVVCKISGLVTESDPSRCGAVHFGPYVTHALECFGFDRVLFAGDWPVCNLAATHSDWTRTLSAIVASARPSDLSKLYENNAERIYRV